MTGGLLTPRIHCLGDEKEQSRGPERRAEFGQRRSATRKRSVTCLLRDTLAHSSWRRGLPRSSRSCSGANHRSLSRPPSRRQQFDRTEFWQPVDPHVHDRSWREVVAVKIESMKRTAKDIFKDALALPAEARSALASRLRESVEPQSEASRRQFVRARRRALKRLRDGLDLHWVPGASRDELYRR